MATLLPKSFVPKHQFSWGDKNINIHDEINKQYEEVEREGFGLYRYQVADGHAEYIIRSLKPLKLQHVDIIDGYSVNPAHIRGLRLADVQGFIRK